jgi:hypothetical protein
VPLDEKPAMLPARDGWPAKTAERVWSSKGRRGGSTAWYNHLYRQPGEHYHPNYKEALVCPDHPKAED